MSTTTRVTTRSSATEEVNIAACAEKINQLRKRSRHASKTGDSPKESTPTVEETPSRSPGSSRDDDVNPVALKLWNQMFKTTDFVEIAAKSDFFHTRVKKLLKLEQVQNVADHLQRDINNRKVDFLKSKETDITKLRLSLQVMFTRLVIRRVKSELAWSKEDANTKLEYLANLDKEALKKWYTQQAKGAERSNRVTGAQDGILELLNIVDEKLAEVEEENPAVGSTEYTLTLIKDFLTKIVEEKRVQLPNIVEGERTEDDSEKIIYRNEYDQLPQDVREYFGEAINLINRANQAATAEEEAVTEYNLIHTRVNSESREGEQLTDLKEKVADIEEAEEIANRIVAAQTFWKYEDIPAPGDNEKIHMDTSTMQKLIDELKGISDTLEDPDLESHPKKLKE